MKKINKRAVAGISVLFVTIIILLTCFKAIFVGQEGNQKTSQSVDQQKSEKIRFNDDGTVTLGEGYTAHGLYTKDGKLVDFGNAVECEGGCIRGCIVFQQNLPGTTEYGLLLMEDFIQKEFKVGNTLFDCYRFSLSGEDTAKVEVELPVMDSAYEMEYLIVPQPDAENFSMDSKSGWNNFLATKNAYASSYKIMDKDGNTRIPPVYKRVDTAKLGEIQYDGDIGFELVKSREELDVFDAANSGCRACLCLGGMRKEVDAYAVVAFCNWKQTEVAKGQLVYCYQSVPDRNSYDEIIFPNIKEDAVYQMFAFEMPIESRRIASVNQTFRIKIRKEKSK